MVRLACAGPECRYLTPTPGLDTGFLVGTTYHEIGVVSGVPGRSGGRWLRRTSRQAKEYDGTSGPVWAADRTTRSSCSLRGVHGAPRTVVIDGWGGAGSPVHVRPVL